MAGIDRLDVFLSNILVFQACKDVAEKKYYRCQGCLFIGRPI